MISVIILHHNKAAYSAACLETLLRATTRPLEIINIDNGSGDATPRLLREWHQRAAELNITVKGRRFEENIGAVRGRNEALGMASGEHIVFLDNDTLLAQPDSFDILRQFLLADPQRAIVAPKLLFPWDPYNIECCGCGVSRQGRIQYIGRGEARASITEARLVQSAISAAWMMPRALVDEIGLLDEVYSPVQYEDLDYCYRAREAGYEVWTLPEVELYHFEHTTTGGSGDINFKYVTVRNGMTFKKRWGETYGAEDGPTDAEAQWLTLPKYEIEAVDWRKLAG